MNETLSDMEATDVAFLPIISPRHMRKEITKTLVKLSRKLKIENERIVYVIVNVLTFMLKYYFEGEELIELLGMINMGFEEEVEKLFNGHINELNDELYQSHEMLKIANKERDNALTDAKIAHEQNIHLIKALNNLKKEGKLTEEDLAAAGITL